MFFFFFTDTCLPETEMCGCIKAAVTCSRRQRGVGGHQSSTPRCFNKHPQSRSSQERILLLHLIVIQSRPAVTCMAKHSPTTY